MSYPVAYRAGASRHGAGAFNQAPANNPNRPPRGFSPIPKFGRSEARRAAKLARDAANVARHLKYARPLLRLAKINPYIRAADLALDLLQLWSPPVAGEATYNVPAGWELTQVCSVNPTNVWYAGGSFKTGCLAMQALTPNGTAENPDPPPGGVGEQTMIFVKGYGVAGTTRYDWVRVYWRPGGFPRPAIDPVTYEETIASPGVALPAIRPLVNPMLDPMFLPIGKPSVPTRPVPGPAQRTRRDLENRPDRVDQRQVGNRPRVPLLPGDAIASDPGAAPRGEIAPTPGVTIQTRIDYRRPPAGTKEQKFIANPAGRNLVVRLFSGITEFGDAIDAIYEAIPKELRGTRRRTLVDKANFVYRNLQHVDIIEALQNLAVNEVEDRAIGKLGRYGAKAAARHNRAVGFATGPAL